MKNTTTHKSKEELDWIIYECVGKGLYNESALKAVRLNPLGTLLISKKVKLP